MAKHLIFKRATGNSEMQRFARGLLADRAKGRVISSDDERASRTRFLDSLAEALDSRHVVEGLKNEVASSKAEIARMRELLTAQTTKLLERQEPTTAPEPRALAPATGENTLKIRRRPDGLIFAVEDERHGLHFRVERDGSRRINGLTVAPLQQPSVTDSLIKGLLKDRE